MHGRIFESKATKIALDCVDLLSHPDKLVVLDHLVHVFRSEGYPTDALDTINAQIKILRGDNRALSGEYVLAVRKQIQDTIDKNQIRAVDQGTVSVNLQGHTRGEFLREVAALVADAMGRQYMIPLRLKEWSESPAFTARIEQGASPLCVEVNMPSSKLKSDREQRALGFNDVSIEDLVTAHAAYYLLTGTDLFNGNTVRCRDGVLHFFEETGLGLASWTLDRAYWMTASRYAAVPQ
jgi:hypothetical protein